MSKSTDYELEERTQNAFAELVSINPQKALALACGMLVGLVEYQAELQGCDASREVVIDGNNESRSITIHKKGLTHD